MRWVYTHWILLTAICIGALLRFTNLNWDLGGRLHPDEALIVNGALSIQFFSQLFPGFHDYNGFSVYLLKLFSLLESSPETVTIIGRFLSAALSTCSIFLVYLTGTRWWNKQSGIVAALLFAFTPLSIQLAHFYTTESIMIFLLLALLLATPSPLRMAIPMGLLLATKNTAYLFFPIALIRIRTFSSLSLFTLFSFIVFFLASPYSFLDFSGYVSRSKYLADVVSGRLLMDWTMQFQEANGLFWIKNLLYALGPLAIIGVIGIIKNAKKSAAFWSIGFLIFLAFTYLKFVRYAAPLIPFFALFGARLISEIKKPAMYSIIGLHIVYGLMFFSLYSTPHTSLQATDWIQTYVPPKSMILVEEWNSIIRFSRPKIAKNGYRIISFNFYALPDDETKTRQLHDLLIQTDYVILESPKVKNTITRLRNRYPHSSAFYDDMESGKLGFKKTTTFTSYPRFGSFVIRDEKTEETYTVFDHPVITIYKK